MVGGKAITAIAGIGTFALLVRELPVEQFAAYSILFALVELVEAITGVGLSQVLSRYVPELVVEHRQHALRRLVAFAMGLRIAILIAFLVTIHLLAPSVAALIGLADWQWALKAYLAVVFFRVVATSLFGVLESILHQATAQLGFGLVTVLRFALLVLATSEGSLDLKTVIMIELVTDIVGFGVMLIGTMRALPRKEHCDPQESIGWVRSNAARMSEFGLKGYAQHLLILPYGGSTNRLLVGGALASPDVALFGFAQSIAELLERYLPVRLLAGVIRPVLTAKYVRHRQFADLEMAANLIFKVNATLICLVAVVVCSGGESMIALATGGKYSQGGVGLLLMMCALVLMYSLRFMLDHVSHAVERNGPLIWSNAVITASMLPGLALLPSLGVYALPLANLIGLVVGSCILVWRLRVAGFKYRHDLTGLIKLLAATVIGIGAGLVLHWLGGGWVSAAALGPALFVASAVLLRPITRDERAVILSLTKQRRNRDA